MAHIPQIKAALGIAGVHTDVYSWRIGNVEKTRGAQIDMLIDRKDGIVNLCEMKYSDSAFVIDADYEKALRKKAEKLKLYC